MMCEALAQLLQRLHGDSDLRQRVGEAAAKMTREWTWDRNAAEVWELLSVRRRKKGGNWRASRKVRCALPLLFCSGFQPLFASPPSVNVSVSFGMLVTNGPTSQPSPVGISRVSETTSLCT